MRALAFGGWLLWGAGCLGNADRPPVDGVVADPGTTTVALAWLPATARTLTPGAPVEVDRDRHFDPAELVDGISEDPEAYDCDDGILVEAVGLGQGCPERQTDPELTLALARILGFATLPVPTDVTPGYEPSRSVSDDVEVVWTSKEITRSSPAWSVFQSELPAGATMVRRVRCPASIDGCSICWPFDDPHHCVEPIGSEEQVLLRAWRDAAGRPRD